jgi:Zn finger protein HypA/HybF involved in hydrogenase expression
MGGTRRFRHILTKRFMKPGKEYPAAWKCKNEQCQQPIVPDETFTDADPDRQSDSAMFIVICPHCKMEQTRLWAGRGLLTYKGGSAC